MKDIVPYSQAKKSAGFIQEYSVIANVIDDVQMRFAINFS